MTKKTHSCSKRVVFSFFFFEAHSFAKHTYNFEIRQTRLIFHEKHSSLSFSAANRKLGLFLAWGEVWNQLFVNVIRLCDLNRPPLLIEFLLVRQDFYFLFSKRKPRSVEKKSVNLHRVLWSYNGRLKWIRCKHGQIIYLLCGAFIDFV